MQNICFTCYKESYEIIHFFISMFLLLLLFFLFFYFNLAINQYLDQNEGVRRIESSLVVVGGAKKKKRRRNRKKGKRVPPSDSGNDLETESSKELHTSPLQFRRYSLLNPFWNKIFNLCEKSEKKKSFSLLNDCERSYFQFIFLF